MESYGTGSQEQPVAAWYDGIHEDYGQWEGRTNITSSEGDLTINNLIIQDDGRYTCRYSTSSRPPDKTGAEYNLVIIGNAWW